MREFFKYQMTIKKYTFEKFISTDIDCTLIAEYDTQESISMEERRKRGERKKWKEEKREKKRWKNKGRE